MWNVEVLLVEPHSGHAHNFTLTMFVTRKSTFPNRIRGKLGNRKIRQPFFGGVGKVGNGKLGNGKVGNR